MGICLKLGNNTIVLYLGICKDSIGPSPWINVTIEI
jgi:hypothetical protein